MVSLYRASRGDRRGPQPGSLAGDRYLPLYVLIAACVAGDLCFVPLLPGLAARGDLSGTQRAVLLSVATAVTMIAAVPLGVLADRMGLRRLLVVAGVAATLAGGILAGLHGFAWLLLARSLIGLSNAVIWTAGTALVAHQPRAVVRAIAAGGVGRLGGPLLTAALAGAAGAQGVFVAAGALTLTATIAFKTAKVPTDASSIPAATEPGADGSLRAALRHSRVRAAALGLLLLGFTEGASNLLAPAQLQVDGLSGGRIGALATVAAATALVAATMARKLLERHDAAVLARRAGLALAICWLIPAASASVPAVAGFLVAFAAARTVLNPASYLLARQGAIAAGASTAITLGATNLLLGVGGLVGPILASPGLAHPRITAAALAVLCLISAAFMTRASHGPDHGRAYLPIIRRVAWQLADKQWRLASRRSSGIGTDCQQRRSNGWPGLSTHRAVRQDSLPADGWR